MKKQLTAVLFALGSLAFAQNSDTYQKQALFSTSGYSFTGYGVNDCIVDGSASKMVGLLQADSGTKTGPLVLKADYNDGTTLSGKMYYPSSGTLGGNRILAIGGNYYMLAGYNSATALIKINGSTGAVMFSEYIATLFHCGQFGITPTDMVYDGSAYIYMVGNQSSTSQIWAAKFDLSGALQWIEGIGGHANYSISAQNIWYTNDTSIYIGGITTSNDTTFSNRGLMIQIDKNGTLINERAMRAYGVLSLSAFESFNVSRNGSYIYTVGSTHFPPDGIGATSIAKFDLSMNLVSQTLYDAHNPNGNYFWYDGNAKVRYTNSKMLVPGTDLIDGSGSIYPDQYVSAFFNLSTGFLNANVLEASHLNPSSHLGNIVSYPYPASNGYIYSLAWNPNSSTSVYYTKGSQNFGYTNNNVSPCDTSYHFVTESGLDVITFSLSASALFATTCTFVCNVSTPALTYTTSCFFCPPCQKTAGISETGFDDNHVSLYPNPGNGHISISYELHHISDLDINVVNSLGQRVYATKQKNIDKTILDYDLSFLEKGIYFIHITDNNNNQVVKKIMIQ